MKLGITCAVAALLVGACTPPAPTEERAAVTASAVVPIDRAPAWPAAPEAAPPAGFSWQTVHHETIHARLLVPDGAKIERTRDGYGYPRVDVAVDDTVVIVQFDSGVGALGATLAKTPPTVYGLPVEAVHVGPENVAAQYRTKTGELRIAGHAPGVKCVYQSFAEPPATMLERAFTVCASLRSPAPGAWRQATSEERANGGATAIPEGAWLESGRPTHPGGLLRPGKLVARLYLGPLVVSGGVCPPSPDLLRTREAPEVEVTVAERRAAAGPAWIRQTTEAYDQHRYPGATTIFAPRAGGCCRAELVPWTSPPSEAQIAYAIALCDTYRPQ